MESATSVLCRAAITVNEAAGRSKQAEVHAGFVSVTLKAPAASVQFAET